MPDSRPHPRVCRSLRSSVLRHRPHGRGASALRLEDPLQAPQFLPKDTGLLLQSALDLLQGNRGWKKDEAVNRPPVRGLHDARIGLRNAPVREGHLPVDRPVRVRGPNIEINQDGAARSREDCPPSFNRLEGAGPLWKMCRIGNVFEDLPRRGIDCKTLNVEGSHRSLHPGCSPRGQPPRRHSRPDPLDRSEPAIVTEIEKVYWSTDFCGSGSFPEGSPYYKDMLSPIPSAFFLPGFDRFIA